MRWRQKGEYREVVGQAGWGYDAVERGSDCEVVGRAEGRQSEVSGRAGLGLHAS